ncbi:MAG: DUF933 domain-containing protein [Dictyoglomus sp.]|nr:DUF933 domain-containing protein [Dictyoglomus sp.]MDW8188530.1 DUF933 domain-containing protein [Dictyoglomus sp.]
MAILIIGRKGSGKSTLLKILSQGKGNIKPFDINIHAVPKEDDRLIHLSKVFQSKTLTPIHMDFIDFPLDATFTKKTPQLTTYVQRSDLILYIIPLFLEEKNPLEEIKEEENEIILNDLEICERLLKDRRINIAEKTLLEKVHQYLMEEKPLSSCDLRLDEIKMLTAWNFLSLKPIFYLINVSQDFMEKKEEIDSIKNSLYVEKKQYLVFSASLEEEILEMDIKDKSEYLSLFGFEKTIKERLYEIIFNYFDLITFFTGNEKEVRAWKLKKGSSVLEAAGTIHTDLAKGFIRAEVISWDKLVSAGSWKTAQQNGLISLEKKEYIVKEGDVIFIRFHL